MLDMITMDTWWLFETLLANSAKLHTLKNQMTNVTGVVTILVSFGDRLSPSENWWVFPLGDSTVTER